MFGAKQCWEHGLRNVLRHEYTGPSYLPLLSHNQLSAKEERKNPASLHEWHCATVIQQGHVLFDCLSYLPCVTFFLPTHIFFHVYCHRVHFFLPRSSRIGDHTPDMQSYEIYFLIYTHTLFIFYPYFMQYRINNIYMFQ